MSLVRILGVLTLGLSLGAAGQYWYTTRSASSSASAIEPRPAAAADRHVLYYRDPTGAPNWSAIPKKSTEGRPYLPVYDDEEVSFAPKPEKAKTALTDRKVLYYRHPMGLPDTSPVPKKDSMGMNYIPVYEGDEPDDGKTVKVSLDRVQRSGVRTEMVEPRVLERTVRGIGTITIDESRQTIVALRADGYIENLFVDTTGRTVRAGEPLFRAYVPDIQTAQADLLVAIGWPQRGGASASADMIRAVEGSIKRLLNLDVPESRIREVRETGANPRTIDWPAPASGTVFDKKIINRQRVMAGDALYRIVDLSRVWVIAEVAEADLADIEMGTPVSVTLRAYPSSPVEGMVTFIYPDIKTETRTARARIELPNTEGRLKIEMYADVLFRPGANRAPVTSVPDSAVIDSGTRQIVLVAKAEGRFEPRPVKLGRRGEGYVEILEGVKEGEKIVTSATFLIDSESNLKAALTALVDHEAPK